MTAPTGCATKGFEWIGLRYSATPEDARLLDLELCVAECSRLVQRGESLEFGETVFATFSFRGDA
jgi:hypothetical protein